MGKRAIINGTNAQKYYLKSVYFTGMDGKEHEIESISPEELSLHRNDLDFKLIMLEEEGRNEKNDRFKPRHRLSQSHR